MRECDVSKPMYEFGLQNGHIMAQIKETRKIKMVVFHWLVARIGFNCL